MTDYSQRLLLPIVGDSTTEFRTHSGLIVAKGYERVVIGDRGPYIEFAPASIVRSSVAVPESERWRIGLTHGIYYYEHRSVDKCNVKFYEQIHMVVYADYRIGMWYASPFDLTSDRYGILVLSAEEYEKMLDEPAE